MKHRKNEGRERRVEKGKKGLKGRRKGGGRGERKFFPCIGPWMPRASMQVLIKRIQKRGASPFCVEMWKRVFWGGPHALRHFNLVSTFYHWAVKLHYLCTSTLGEATGSKQGKGLRGNSLLPPFFSPPRINVTSNPQGSLTREVINFIYTLIRSSNKISHCE